MKIFGIILVLAGILALAYGGFTYTTHKRALDLGPLQLEHKRRHTVPLPPLLGVSGMLFGGALLVAGSSKGR